jgi:hypothetical protein
MACRCDDLASRRGRGVSVAIPRRECSGRGESDASSNSAPGSAAEMERVPGVRRFTLGGRDLRFIRGVEGLAGS